MSFKSAESNSVHQSFNVRLKCPNCSAGLYYLWKVQHIFYIPLDVMGIIIPCLKDVVKRMGKFYEMQWNVIVTGAQLSSGLL